MSVICSVLIGIMNAAAGSWSLAASYIMVCVVRQSCLPDGNEENEQALGISRKHVMMV